MKHAPRPSRRKFDFDFAFALYVQGVPAVRIAQKCKVSRQTVDALVIRENWPAKRQAYEVERVKAIGANCAKSQEDIRAEEYALAKELLNKGRELLERYKIPKRINLADICRVLELGSRLGRLGTGLPLVPMELTVAHTISEDIQRMLDKAYGDQPAQVTDAKPVIEAEVVQDLTQQVVVKPENVK